MSEVVLPLVVIVALILLNGLFVAAEFAIVGSRKPRVEQQGKGLAARYVSRVLSSPRNQDRYIAIAQLGITLATIGLGMYGEPSIAGWVYGPIERVLGMSEAASHTVGTVLAVLVMTYFHVVVGEMIPKALALQTPERVAIGVAHPMRFTGVVFYPLVMLLNGTGNLLLRLFRVPSGEGSRLYSSAELVQLVEESHEEGVVSEEEERLIRNILDFGERQVQEVMVPRVRVTGIPLDATIEGVRELLTEHAYSRYPVYRENLDQLVGILHVKDFIERDVRGEPFDLRSMVRRVPRVPEAMPVESLLTSFKRLRVHMAIVLDEHGGTSGIVTLDDLLEEVVGEVEDDFDVDEVPEVEELTDGRYLVDGGMPIYHFNDRFDKELVAEDSTTIAGLILESLKRAPEAGDELTLDGLLLRVEEVDGLAIRRVLLEPAIDELPNEEVPNGSQGGADGSVQPEGGEDGSSQAQSGEDGPGQAQGGGQDTEKPTGGPSDS